MRYGYILFIVLAVSLMSACSGSTVPTSSLTIRDSATDALLSTSRTQGTINLSVGNTRQIKVLHTYVNKNNVTRTDDVTQFVIFKRDSGTSAQISQLGTITGLAVGTTVLRAKYTSGQFGTSDNCRITIVVAP